MIKYEDEFEYIRLNLQFFANDEGGEKTEEPTQKKKTDAREEGQVAKSVEITTAFFFIGVFFALRLTAEYMYNKLAAVMNHMLLLIKSIKDGVDEIDYITELISYMFGQVILISAPIFIVSMVIGLITNLVQVGWHPTTKTLKPKFSHLSPLSGVKRLFSMRSVVELIKSIFKITIIGIVIYNMIKDELGRVQTLLDMEILQAIIYLGNMAIDIGLVVGVYFIFLALADYLYQKFEHNKQLKMTKQEVKDEYKNAEGDPQIKGKRRQKMREASIRRMMHDVPKADVIITNPTHFAVALQYDKEKGSAPIVIAKGADHLAQRIKAVAKENNVEIVENKYLARTIYSTVEIGKEIPPELYQAVAEVLAFVYNIKNKSHVV